MSFSRLKLVPYKTMQLFRPFITSADICSCSLVRSLHIRPTNKFICRNVLITPNRNFSLGLRNVKNNKVNPEDYRSEGPRRIAQNTPKSKRSSVYYMAAIGVLVLGGSYCAVPLYRIFCQSYSYGGTTNVHDTSVDISNMKKKDREIKITFNADRSSALQWNFHPQQLEIYVHPGETALAFYRAENKTDKPIDGISTYNVIPFEAGAYFNKIQCFCFEEQRLNPGETVELPVFFYIDPEFTEDPKMENVNHLTLSYTFFESKEMPDIKIPWGVHGNRNID